MTATYEVVMITSQKYQIAYLIQCKEWKSLSHVWLLQPPWTVAHQVPLSMGFSRQEDWSGLPFPSPRDLPNLGIEPMSPALQANSIGNQNIIYCSEVGGIIFS